VTWLNNDTLIKGSLIQIDTSKESDVYAYLIYIGFIKSYPSKIQRRDVYTNTGWVGLLVLPIKSYKFGKMLQIFEKRGKHPLKIVESY